MTVDSSVSNVFAPEFLEQVSEREPPPLTGPEAVWAGPWRIEPHGKAFAVVRESGGKPVAVTERRETALLITAVLPATGRDQLYWIDQQGEDGIALATVRGMNGSVTAGRLPHEPRGLAEALSVAECLLRSPTALAFLLEAAPFETLEQAGAVLARRMSERSDAGAEDGRPTDNGLDGIGL